MYYIVKSLILFLYFGLRVHGITISKAVSDEFRSLPPFCNNTTFFCICSYILFSFEGVYRVSDGKTNLVIVARFLVTVVVTPFTRT
jgi:hypothetical protein